MNTTNKLEEKRPTVVSLFSGCGGMDLGLVGSFDFLGQHYEATGFNIIWANEWNPAACQTYRANFSHPLIEGDIAKHIEALPPSADVVVGGFPCQDISVNGKMKGLDGERSSLYKYIVKAVQKLSPKVFIAENVGGLLTKRHEKALAQILSDFKALGYHVDYHLYHAEQFGVPQTRARVFLVGTREDVPSFTPPSPLFQAPITAQAALQDLEQLDEDKAFAHIWSKARPSAQQGSRRLKADRPGYTIRAECHGNTQFHYNLSRRISLREAARIQSFPDSFVFTSGIRETERQIGNAVPPVLAWHIANAIKPLLAHDVH